MTHENVYFKVEEVDQVSPVVFTRYLYIRREVEDSLIMAILGKRCDDALFWAYELYYSGFENDTVHLLTILYEDYFQEHDRGEHLGSFLYKIGTEWKAHFRENNSAEDAVATIILNLCRREYTFSPSSVKACRIVIEGPPSYQYVPLTKSNRRIYIHADRGEVAKYATVAPGKYDSRRVLENVCHLTPIRNIKIEYHIGQSRPLNYNSDGTTIQEKYNLQWIYYASFSPIWKRRIDQYGGICDHSTKKVVFEPDLEDAFYELYQYDPDEQDASIKSRNIP